VFLDRPIILGSAIETSPIFLLDKNLEEREVGEICISGPALAIGCFNDEEMKHRKFINLNRI